MATFTVTTNLDSIDDTDGLLSLREAIVEANATVGADTIVFDTTVFTGGANSLIRLTLGTELEITDQVVIDGSSAIGVTVSGDVKGDDELVTGTFITDGKATADTELDDNVRVFNITDPDAATTLKGLTVTGGRTVENNTYISFDIGFEDTHSGGGVRSLADLEIVDATISGNWTEGDDARGGGFFADVVTIYDSTISGNWTEGESAFGGGVLAGSVTAINTTISGNWTKGVLADGGGIAAASMTAIDTTISGNWTENNAAYGGGISARSVELTNSTISGNWTDGLQSDGGGIYAGTFGSVTAINTTISGNWTKGGIADGGGIAAGLVTAINTTISGNWTEGLSAIGGGIYVTRQYFSDGVFTPGTAELTNSIVLGNDSLNKARFQSEGAEIYLSPPFRGSPGASITYFGLNVVGGEDDDPADGVIGADVNAVFRDTMTVDPDDTPGTGDEFEAGALSDNGGSVETIALLDDDNNPAVDSGDNDLAVDADGDPLTSDARDDIRIINDVVDLGAFELQRLDAIDDIFVTEEDVVVEGNVLSNDGRGEGETLTPSLVRDVSNGTLVFNADGTFTYTPDADFNGTDTFVYSASDGSLNDTATATITVDAVNDGPVAVDDAFATDEDAAFAGNLLADNGNGADIDIEGDTLFVIGADGRPVGAAVALASGALLTVASDGTFVYDPNGAFEYLAEGESTTDSFSYRIYDGTTAGPFSTATATITVDGVNDAPDAMDDSFDTGKSGLLTGNVLVDNGNGADSDPDNGTSLTVTAVNGSAGNVGSQVVLPSGALLTLNADGSFSYDTNSAFDPLGDNQTFADSFTYTIGDGDGGSDGATATVTITGGNEAPVAADDSFLTDEDTAIGGNVITNDSDPNNDTLTVSAVDGVGSAVGSQIVLASGARLLLNADGSFSYDPTGIFDDLSPGEADSDSFTYTVTDGNGGADMATVTIGIDGLVDIIRGTPGDDNLSGTNGDDLIYALARDDVIDPRGGSHTIDGDEGTDTVVYSGPRSDYAIDLRDDGSIVVDRPDSETDTLIAVERIDLADGDLIYDIDSINLGLVYRMYQAAVGRTPDETGVRFWTDRLDFLDIADPSRDKQLFLANQFLGSDEFAMLYGANPSNEQYIDAMYQHVLGRFADAIGRAFWIDGMNQGLGRDDILVAFAESDENRLQTGPDLDDGVWVV